MFIIVLCVAVTVVLAYATWRFLSWQACDDSGVQYEAGKWRRPCGLQETFHLRHLTSDTLLVCCVQFFVSSVPVPTELFQKALSIVAKKHPILRSKYAEINEKPHLQEMDEVTISWTESDATDWTLVSEIQTQCRFDKWSGPLWRVVYLPNIAQGSYTDEKHPFQYVLAFVYNHAILDDTSSLLVTKDFMLATSGLLRGEVKEDDAVESLPVPMPLDQLHPDLRATKARGIWGILQLMFSRQMISVSRTMKEGNAWIRKFPMQRELTPDAEVKSCVIPMEFSADVTKAVMGISKQHGVGVHSVMVSIAAISVTQMLQGGSIQRNGSVLHCTSASTKRWFPEYVANQGAGFYASGVVAPVHVNAEWRDTFWEMAKKTHDRIHSHLVQDCLFNISMLTLIDLLAGLGRLPEPMTGRNCSRMEHVFDFTNIGNCEHVNDGDDTFKLRARYLSAGIHRWGSIFFNSLATLNGRMLWGVTYVPHVTKKEVAEEYTRRIQTIIKELFH